MRLAPDWAPSRDPAFGHILPEGQLWLFIERIARSRREGKNRRDGATVSTRVLRLVDNIGQKLFEDAQAAGALDSVHDGKEVRSVRRKIRLTQAHL